MDQLTLFEDLCDEDPVPRRKRTSTKLEKMFAQMYELVTDPQLHLFRVERTCPGCGKTSVFFSVVESAGWMKVEITGSRKEDLFVCSIGCLPKPKPVERAQSAIVQLEKFVHSDDELLSIF